MKNLSPKVNTLILLVIIAAGFLLGAVVIGLVTPLLAKNFDEMTAGIIGTVAGGIAGLIVIYGLLELWGRYLKSSGKKE